MSDQWYYERAGKLYPRATAVLEIVREPGIEAWRDRIGAEAAAKIADKAAKIGTRLHGLISMTLAGKAVPARKVPVNPLQRRAWQTWLQWYAAQQRGLEPFKPKAWEVTCYNDIYGYAGTPDCYEEGPDVARITDWKFASRIRPSHFIQLHAYAPLIWPYLIPQKLRLRVVRIDPELGVWEEQEQPFQLAVLTTYLHLLAVYKEWYFKPALAAWRVAEKEVQDEVQDVEAQ